MIDTLSVLFVLGLLVFTVATAGGVLAVLAQNFADDLETRAFLRAAVLFCFALGVAALVVSGSVFVVLKESVLP